MDERRGLVVRRERGEGFVDVSVSSTSNDRFSARKQRTFVVSQKREQFIKLHRRHIWGWAIYQIYLMYLDL